MDWFERSTYLYFLFGILLIGLLYLLFSQRQKRAMRKFAHPSLFDELMPLRSQTRRSVKLILGILAIAFLTIALAKPKLGEKRILKEAEEETEEIRMGIEVMIALDVSYSMRAKDEQPDRLSKAKMTIEKIISKLDDDKIGLVAFAGEATMQVPITTDFNSAEFIVRSLNTNLIRRQGTAIGSAIDLCANAFSPDEVGKAIIVISDGENHEGDAVRAAQRAAGKGIKVYTVGIGTVAGATVPEKGDRILKDKDGNPVIARLNAAMLSQIAEAGQGKFFMGSSVSELSGELISDMKKVPKAEAGEKATEYITYKDGFQYFLATGLFFLIIEMLILGRRNRKLMDLSIFGSGNRLLMGVLLLFLFPSLSVGQYYKKQAREGNYYYQHEEYDKAIQKYKAALRKDTANDRLNFNLGNAYYRKYDADSAIKFYEAALNVRNGSPKTLSRHYYNLGNTYFQAGNYYDSRDAYIESLKLFPKNEDARHNLFLVQEMLRSPQMQQQQQEKQRQEQEQKKKEQEKQKQAQEQKKKEQEKQKQEQEQKKQEQEQQKQEQEKQKQDQGKGENQPDNSGQDQQEQNQEQGNDGNQPDDSKQQQGDQKDTGQQDQQGDKLQEDGGQSESAQQEQAANGEEPDMNKEEPEAAAQQKIPEEHEPKNISEDDAIQIFKAIEADEQKTIEKVRRAKALGSPVGTEPDKNW